MSTYSNVTEQDLNNLRKLAEQQKNQRALKNKIRILNQTHDIKLADPLSPIAKNLEEVNGSTQKLGDTIKENNTPQLAIENSQNELPTENEQTHPEVIYDTSLENTLSNMQREKRFFKIEEKDNGDIIWNGFQVEKLGRN